MPKFGQNIYLSLNNIYKNNKWNQSNKKNIS